MTASSVLWSFTSACLQVVRTRYVLRLHHTVEGCHRAPDRTRSREKARGLHLVFGGATGPSSGARYRSALVRDPDVLGSLRRLG